MQVGRDGKYKVQGHRFGWSTIPRPNPSPLRYPGVDASPVIRSCASKDCVLIERDERVTKSATQIGAPYGNGMVVCGKR